MTSRRLSVAIPAALVVISTIFAWLLTLVVEWCAGLLMGIESDLVFDRYSTVSYSTPEFRATARINNLGYRGDNIDPRRRKRYRIATLGDSFTFGWGVEHEETWPKVLESSLRARGFDVEVMNLGQPGAGPAEYAEIAEKALPLLRPDLVVVAINQADDLGQIMRAAAAPRRQESERSAWTSVKAVVKAMYPNLLELRRRVSPPAAESATAVWKDQVAGLLSGLNPEQSARLGRIDGEIKDMFIRGELNPGLLAASLHRPDEMWNTLDLRHPRVRDGIEEMSRDLSRIKASAEAVTGKVVVVSLPNGYFVSPELLVSYQRMGYAIDRSCLTTTAMDDAVREAAAKPAIEVFDVTRPFREESAKRRLFFTFDLHYNGQGQRYFAESISPFVAAKLETAARL